MTEWSSQFFDLFTHSAHFRAGFIWALVMVGLGWLVLTILNWLYAQWLRVRKFFEPTQQPGKMPVVAGSSPAGILLGCLGGILVIVLPIGIVIMVLFWRGS